MQFSKKKKILQPLEKDIRCGKRIARSSKLAYNSQEKQLLNWPKDKVINKNNVPQSNGDRRDYEEK